MKPIITVEGVSKRYTIGKKESYGSLRDEVMDALSSPFRRVFGGEKAEDPSVWALKDVSFEVSEGDVLGIIGRNGAGKSTLLKILSRIVEPTEGRIEMRGRMASLLEVGTGFHPELTGRENIFMNGALLGMTSAEIRAKFDEIVAFSEIEKFLDTPVKRYSSGMYVRLAFAVAAHLEPEILVIDEVLAVGDAAFQKKCLGKMGEVAKGGRTVLFVSHNMGAIRSLCGTALLLSGGRLLKQGATAQVLDEYTSAARDGVGKGEVCWPDRKEAPGGKELRLFSIRLLNEKDEVQGSFDGEKVIKIEINFELLETVREMEISLQIINSDGVIVFTTSDYAQQADERKIGVYTAVCIIPGGLLNSGFYLVKINSNIPCVKVLLSGWEFVGFNLERTFNHSSVSLARWPGIVAPRLEWKTWQHK